MSKINFLEKSYVKNIQDLINFLKKLCQKYITLWSYIKVLNKV